ncbi:hypothetical protein NPIL_451641 [Nephila pilipes]|uniref:Uncharacterized protein n=1 Tax=Nephila pilipes TaxID=299642 RepID=A0A8X6NAZ5_NEPPI|nr:hypothetical protein NPIL_451641 [Nephila pilipes]
MYHQILVASEDQNFQQIVWRESCDLPLQVVYSKLWHCFDSIFDDFCLKQIAMDCEIDISDIVPYEQWSRVQSKENSADLASRGVNPGDLANSTLWWYGPPSLFMNKNYWPQQSLGVCQSTCPLTTLLKNSEQRALRFIKSI